MSRSSRWPHAGGSSFCALGCLFLLATALSAAAQTPPHIVVPPQDQYACAGGDATFYAAATGSQPMDVYWLTNGNTALFESGKTNSFLTLTNVQDFNNGTLIEVYFTNPVSFAHTNAHLYVPNPGICQQPTDTVVPPGGTILFDVIASGTPSPGYQWYFQGSPLTNGGNVHGADSQVLVITNAQPTDAGFYQVVVTNFLGSVTSVLAHCSVATAPTCGDPLSRIVRFAASTTFTNTYTGTPPLSYRWFRNDVPLPNATNSSLTVTNCRRPEVGLYHVVVTNVAGSATSRKAHLQVRITLETTSPIYREEATDEYPNLTNAVVVLVVTDTAVFHGVPLLFSTYNATAGPGETNFCDGPATHNMWVRYDAPRAELTKVSTEGSTFDTVVSVYEWDGIYGHPLSLIQCDNNSGYDGVTSLLTFESVANRRYYICVDGVGGTWGTVRLQVGENIRKARFEPATGRFRFEIAGSYWMTNILRTATSLDPPLWSNLLTIPKTNSDWIIGYTNTSPLSSPRRFYSVIVTP